MKRGWAFAALLAAAVGLLGFVLVYGVQAVSPDDDHQIVLHGWQVTATQSGLLGSGLVVGLVAAVLTWRRLRALEGEGLVYGPPALLVGVLITGLCAAGATSAAERAQEHTAEAQGLRDQYAADLLALEKHPYVMRRRGPAAAPELELLSVRATDLGKDWYDATEPRAVRGKDAATAVVLLTREHKAAHGWEADALVRQTVTRASTVADAQLLMAAGEAPRQQQRIHGCDVSVVTSTTDFGSVTTAWFRRGLVVWQVRVAPMNRAGFTPAEVAATLERVVLASTT